MVARAGQNGGSSNADLDAGHLILSNDPAHAICHNEQRTYTNEGSVFQLRNVVAQPAPEVLSMRESGPGFWMKDDIAGTLRAEGENRPSRPSNVVAQPAQDAVAFQSNLGSHGGDVFEDGTSPTVRVGSGLGIPSPPAVAFTKSKRAQSNTDDETWVPGEVSPTMSCFDSGDTRATTVVACGAEVPMVNMQGSKSNSVAQAGGPSYTLNSMHGHDVHAIESSMAVRRLTPRECERLQGFPDDYTLVEYRKKPAADGPRYKALGNSMAVPVMRWIGERINLVAALDTPVKR